MRSSCEDIDGVGVDRRVQIIDDKGNGSEVKILIKERMRAKSDTVIGDWIRPLEVR